MGTIIGVAKSDGWLKQRIVDRYFRVTREFNTPSPLSVSGRGKVEEGVAGFREEDRFRKEVIVLEVVG